MNSSPSLHHLLGTDDLGRDIFSRIVYGSRISIVVSLGAMVIGFGIGMPLGMLAAYRRGKFDAILSTVMYVFLAFPAIIATIAVLSFWTPTVLVQDHRGDRDRRDSPRVSGYSQLHDGLRVPGLRARGQGPGRHRPAHPDERTPAQHRPRGGVVPA